MDKSAKSEYFFLLWLKREKKMSSELHKIMFQICSYILVTQNALYSQVVHKTSTDIKIHQLQQARERTETNKSVNPYGQNEGGIAQAHKVLTVDGSSDL